MRLLSATMRETLPRGSALLFTVFRRNPNGGERARNTLGVRSANGAARTLPATAVPKTTSSEVKKVVAISCNATCLLRGPA